MVRNKAVASTHVNVPKFTVEGIMSIPKTEVASESGRYVIVIRVRIRILVPCLMAVALCFVDCVAAASCMKFDIPSR